MRIPVTVRSPIFIAGILAALASGILLGYFFHRQNTSYDPVHEETSEYHFIKPLLYVRVPEEHAFPRYTGLKHDLESFANHAKSSKKVDEVSVYFRNMDSSQWTGVNQDVEFSPGSMLKVVTLMAVLRSVQSHPELLQSRILVSKATEDASKEQTLYPPQHAVTPGTSYTLEELLARTAENSDNLANAALYQYVGDARVMDIYEDLEIPKPTRDDHTYTAQEYSRLFRTLYNGGYLSRDLSEKVLSLLSKSAFTQGIAAGVPANVPVSHKFGVRTVINDSGETRYELHDCGIVYAETYPYFICVMTRGTELTQLESTLAEASALVWKQVEKIK